MYKRDGSVIPAGIEEQDNPISHDRMFGVYRGVVKDIIYPDDEKSTSKDRIEYVVRIGNSEYPNCIDVRQLGGRFNYSERTRDITQKNLDDENLKESTYEEKTDGEIVWVMFVEGNGDFPIIIGGFQHPWNRAYHLPKKEDYPYNVTEFHGVEVKTDKDSNYTIKRMGVKDSKGELSEAQRKAVDSLIKFHGNGDIELNTHGTEGYADVRIKLNKELKKIEMSSQNNKIVLDDVGILSEDKNGNKVSENASGILFQDKNGNKVVMDASGILLEDKNGNKLTLGASGININSSANLVKIDGSAYGTHQHNGNLGFPTPPPLDANTE